MVTMFNRISFSLMSLALVLGGCASPTDESEDLTSSADETEQTAAAEPTARAATQVGEENIGKTSQEFFYGGFGPYGYGAGYGAAYGVGLGYGAAYGVGWGGVGWGGVGWGGVGWGGGVGYPGWGAWGGCGIGWC